MTIPTDLVHQLFTMLVQERTAYKRYDYMHSTKTSVSPSDRRALCEWGYGIMSAFAGVDRFTTVLAISYFDRFLSTSNPLAKLALADKIQFQLVFVACLVLALKVHKGFTVELDFVCDVICHGAYDADAIVLTEREVLEALDWRLNGPTPHDFIDGFLRLLPPMESMRPDVLSRYSKALAERALARYSMALEAPSWIAVASLVCGLRCVASAPLVAHCLIVRIADRVLGLKENDGRFRGLCKKMEWMMQEDYLFGDDGESLGGARDEWRAVCIANDETFVDGKVSPIGPSFG